MNRLSELNLVPVVLTGFSVSVSLADDVRAQFFDRPFVGILPVMLPYVAAAALVFLFTNDQKRFIGIGELAGISILGSLMLSAYIFIHTVISVSMDQSPVPAARFYWPTFSVFLFVSLVSFVSMTFVLGAIRFFVSLGRVE